VNKGNNDISQALAIHETGIEINANADVINPKEIFAKWLLPSFGKFQYLPDIEIRNVAPANANPISVIAPKAPNEGAA
jgi:hypothetical protein